ncbi:hypothetical protein LIER_37489 [Lithospermum erythrorhizon]|uniref:Uncharacterized protein n=1 Tax=Lithospermum erythrorhizon TaxID=34254 RepID=A0AAV3PML8_LITER
MARTKSTLKRSSPPTKRAKALGGVKYACPSPLVSLSTSARPMTGALSPKPFPDRAVHNALSPLLDQGVIQSMANLGVRHQASQEASRLWIQAASTSQALEMVTPFCLNSPTPCTRYSLGSASR